MEYALIINTDLSFSRRLRQSLAKIRQIKVSVVPTLIDAQLAIMRHPQDWIFVSVNNKLCEAVVSLYNLQPDARLIAIRHARNGRLPVTCSDKIEGSIRHDWSENDLQAMIEASLISKPLNAVAISDGQPDTAILIAALQQVELDQVVQTAIIVRDDEYLAHWGRLTITQARYIVRLVSKEWLAVKPQTRLQFIPQPDDAHDLLLYTHRVTDHDYFIFTALAKTPMSELRQRAKVLTAVLINLLNGNAVMSIDDVMFSAKGENSYAIVWRAMRALPVRLYQTAQTAIERLATANACHIIHADIQSKYIHLVISCPPQRDSAWAAILFKKGSEETIQQQANINTPLWDHGFYATASKRPLTDLELQLFLKK